MRVIRLRSALAVDVGIVLLHFRSRVTVARSCRSIIRDIGPGALQAGDASMTLDHAVALSSARRLVPRVGPHRPAQPRDPIPSCFASASPARIERHAPIDAHPRCSERGHPRTGRGTTLRFPAALAPSPTAPPVLLVSRRRLSAPRCRRPSRSSGRGAASAVALETARAARRRTCAPRHHRRQRPGARRRLGGPSRRAATRAARSPCSGRASIASIQPSTASSARRRSRGNGLVVSEYPPGDAAASASTSRCAIA